jgi:hypothetical protein
VAGHRLLRAFFGAFESAAPVYRAGTMDEYRELSILAHAWEHGSLEAGWAAEALDWDEQEQSKAPPLR